MENLANSLIKNALIQMQTSCIYGMRFSSYGEELLSYVCELQKKLKLHNILCHPLK